MPFVPKLARPQSVKMGLVPTDRFPGRVSPLNSWNGWLAYIASVQRRCEVYAAGPPSASIASTLLIVR